MNCIVTGGAGFIGRWVCKLLLDEGVTVYALDDLSNGRLENIAEFKHNDRFKFFQGDILDRALLNELFETDFSVCYHLGASINVQDSIDNPESTFLNDTLGTFYILEKCREKHVKIVFMSTCMVYDKAESAAGISESDRIKPASPYAGAKIAAENMVLSYYYAYGLKAVVVRPFNTYGPFQKTGGEGGVVAIFLKKALENKTLSIYGDGTQTRDLLYVADCARFVVMTGLCDSVNGEIVNAGLGRDISVNDLALLICGDHEKINHVAHIHPQSEIMKLLCNFEKAKKLLDWEPQYTLEMGIEETRKWILANGDLI